MAEQTDYRSSKMESLEGHGYARARWIQFLYEQGPGVVEAAFPDGFQAFGPVWAKETSELIGFWVAWHYAGGFEALEHAGWNRATIFRKIRRFRTVFGKHPDEYQFSWLKLSLRKGWDAIVADLLHINDPPLGLAPKDAPYDW